MSRGKAKPPFSRIESDPTRVGGQPCIVGTRLTVRRVVQLAAAYADRAELVREYPELDAESIRQALEFAAANLEDHVVPARRAS